MFVMRPIIHSICSVSAESPHCSPTIELLGAFNPSASRGGRRLFCDIMHSTNTLNESPPACCTDSSALHGYWHGCTEPRLMETKVFPKRFSHFFPCSAFKLLCRLASVNYSCTYIRFVNSDMTMSSITVDGRRCHLTGVSILGKFPQSLSF